MQVAKEQISDLKKKLIMVDNAKGVAEFARDEKLGPSRRLSLPELRLKLLGTRPRKRVTRQGWLIPMPPLKLKSQEYAGYTAPRFGKRPSSELR